MGFSMEKHITISEVKLNSLRELRDQASEQVSIIMMFLVKWKGLVEDFETMRTDFLEQAQELALQEKKLVEDSNLLKQREKEVEIKLQRFDDCSDELETREKELDLIKAGIQDSTVEMKSKQNQLNLVKEEIGECYRELSSKKDELGLVKTELDECDKEIFIKKDKLHACSNELEMKEKELNSIKAQIQDSTVEINSKQKQLNDCNRELSSKKEELGLVKAELIEYDKETFLKKEKLFQCSDKLEMKEKELDSIKAQLQDSTMEINSKQKQLNLVQEEIEECSRELSLKKEELGLVKMELEECGEEILLKKENIYEVKKLLEIDQKSIKDCERELDSKRKELERVQTLTDESKKTYDLLQKELNRICYLMEKRSKELDSKELELNSIKQLIEDYSEELEDKEKRHDVTKNSVDTCSMKLKLKEKELELIEMSLKENSEKLHTAEEKLHTAEEKLDSIQKCRENEEKKLSPLKESIKLCELINLKGQELNAIQISIEDHRKELELEEELLKSVKLKIEESTVELMSKREEQISIQKLSMECSKELESKQSKLDSVIKSLEGGYNDLCSKEVQQGVLQIVCCEYLRELQEQKTHLDSLKRATEKRVEELQKEENQLEGKVKKLKSMKQQSEFRQQTSEELRGEAQLAGKQISTIFPSSQNIEQYNSSFISLSPVLQCCIVGNGSKLQMLLNEQLRKNDLLHLEIIRFIKMSSDPAKLVLDAMQGFHPAGLNNGHTGFDLGIIRRSCVTLLEHIAKLSPQIKPHVREEAMKLAMGWKEKMKLGHENSLDALALLKLLAAYKLDCACSVDEFRNLLEVVECKQKRDLYEAIGKGMPHVDVEQSECSESNQLCSSSANFHSNATGSERSPELLLNHLVVDHDLSIDEVSAGLKFSPDPAKLVLDVMQRSYFQFWNNESTGFDAHLMRNTVLLLEQLMKISPKISHQVKETALQQVLLWKDNISTETQNSSEVLAFLMFLAVYDLVSYFRRDDILIIVETIVHYKQAPEICRGLGITDEIAGLTVNLIQRKQLLEAARFSSAFALSDKFLPQNILTKYLQSIKKGVLLSSNGNNSFQERCKTIDKEAGALRDFLECVVDCKLESIFPPENYIHYIAARQGVKARLAQPFSAPPFMAQQPLQAHMAQQPPQGSNSYMVGPPNHSHRQFFGPGKRPRLDTTVFESYQGSIAPRYGYPGGYFHAPN